MPTVYCVQGCVYVCHDRYKLLEIELDAIFKCMLLLKKKKYAAIKLEPGPNNTLVEVGSQISKARTHTATCVQTPYRGAHVMPCVFCHLQVV